MHAKRAWSVWLCAAAITTAASVVQAVDRSWIGVDEGIFGDPKNWSPGGVPSGVDNAFFNVSIVTQLDVNFFADHSHNRLVFRRGFVDFEMTSNTYTLTTALGSSIIVGDTAGLTPCSLRIFGTLEGVNMSIATATGSSGTFTVGSTSSVLDCSGAINVGVSGDGTLNIQSGPLSGQTAQAFSGSGVIGQFAGSTGDVDLTGPNADWSISGPLTIGAAGTGDMSVFGTVAFGSPSASAASVVIGDLAGSDGSLRVDGPGATFMCSGSIIVGDAGVGRMDIKNGASVTSNIVSDIGAGAGSSGQVFLTDAGSSWASTAPIRIGQSGTGFLSIAPGCSVSAVPSVTIFSGDTLAGGGLVDANVNNNGGLVRPESPGSPAFSFGALQIDGSYTQQASGSLAIQIGGGSATTLFDRVNVIGGGSAVLNGTLTVSLVGFTPVLGNAYFIITTAPGGTISGTFSNEMLPAAPADQRWCVSYGLTAVLARLTKRADLNCDGVVAGLDIGILLAAWSIPAGSPGCGGATPCLPDLNGDGVVDGLDVGILLANWSI